MVESSQVWLHRTRKTQFDYNVTSSSVDDIELKSNRATFWMKTRKQNRQDTNESPHPHSTMLETLNLTNTESAKNEKFHFSRAMS